MEGNRKRVNEEEKKQKTKRDKNKQCSRELATVIFQQNYKKWLAGTVYTVTERETNARGSLVRALGVMQMEASEVGK